MTEEELNQEAEKLTAWGSTHYIEREPVSLERVQNAVLILATSVKKEGGEAYESAWHSDEDLILFNVLKAIAEGAPNAPELAKEAIKVRDIDFSRWYE